MNSTKYDFSNPDKVRDLSDTLMTRSNLGLKTLLAQIDAEPEYIRLRYSVSQLRRNVILAIID